MSTLSQSPLTLDQYAASLGSLNPIDVLQPTEDGMDCTVQMRIHSKDVVARLLILESRLRFDIDAVNAEIMHWGRLTAQARRCWVIRERQARVWKASMEVRLRQEAEAAGKKITESAVEAAYRTASDYGVVSAKQEASEEAFNALDAIYRAFKTKADVLMADVRRVPDGSLQRLSP